MAANSPIDCASRSESGLAQRLYRELLNSTMIFQLVSLSYIHSYSVN